MKTEEAKRWLEILNTRKEHLIGLKKSGWYRILKDALESLIRDREILKAAYLKVKRIEKGY